MNGIFTLAFSPNGRWLASAFHGEGIRRWNAETGALQNRLEGEVMDTIFSPNGRWILSASSRKTIRLWEAETGHLRGVTETPLNP